MQEDHKEVQKELDEIRDVLQNPHEGSREEDEWISGCFRAPSVLPSVVETAAVQELRNVVLTGSSELAVGTIGVTGNGGVGKTVACTVIANDPVVRSKFADGVLWISFGMDITPERVLQELADITAVSGGVRVADKVKSAWRRSAENAVWVASSWFRDRKVLLVVDNVWPGTNGEDWVALLTDLVGTAGCVLFSTRFDSIAASSDVYRIELDALNNRELQVSVFDKHLGISGNDARYNSKVRDHILAVCTGLPLALANAASLVRLLQYQWEDIDNDLEKALVTAKSDESPGSHSGLASTIAVSLAKLDSKELGGNLLEQVNSESPEYSWSEGYYALAVMPKTSPSMPVRMLGLLWSLEEKQAKQVISMYRDLGLASVEDSIVKLHDMQWLFCQHKCRKESSLHERLVRALPCLSRSSTLCGSGQVQGGQDDQVLDLLISDMPDVCEDYLIDNAPRHVSMAGGRLSSLHRLLLTDYRWIRKKAARRSLLNVAADYGFVRHTTESSTLAQSMRRRLSIGRFSSVSDNQEGYEAIGDVLRKIPYEAASGAANKEPDAAFCPLHGVRGDRGSDSGLAGQLIGRLAFQYAVTFSRSVGEAGGKSGIPGSERTSTEIPVPPSSAPATITSDLGFWGRVTGCFRACCASEHAVGGKKLSISLRRRRARKNLWNSVVFQLLSSVFQHASGLWLCPLTDHFALSERKCEQVIPVGRGSIYTVAVSVDDQHVYSACQDGVVRQHCLISGKLVAELRGHSGQVNSIALAIAYGASRGELVVSGASDGTVRCWIMPSKDCVAVLQEHTQSVECVAVSQDGSRIVSGSRDTTMCVWDRTRDGSWTLKGLLNDVHPVMSVAVSEDGRKIASISRGSLSRSTVVLWEETARKYNHNNQIVFQPIQRFGERTFGAHVIFTAGEDDAEVMWGLQSGICSWKREAPEERNVMFENYHVECFTSSFGREGRIVAAGFAGTVLVGRLGGSELLSRLSGHSGRVKGVALTRDGQRIVSCSDDGTLRVWTVLPTEGDDMSKQPSAEKNITSDAVTAAAVSENGNTVVTVHDRVKIRIWDVEEGSCGPDLQVELPVSEVALSQDGKVFVAVDVKEKVMYYWNAVSKEMRRIELASGFARSLSLSRNGRYAVVDARRKYEVWDLEAQKLVAKEAAATCVGSYKPVDALTKYVQQQGLEESAYPAQEYSIAGLSQCSSDLIVRITKSQSSIDRDTDRPRNLCLCAAPAFLEGSVWKVTMLPYVRGLDPMGREDKASLGMIAVQCRSSMMGRKLELFKIMN